MPEAVAAAYESERDNAVDGLSVIRHAAKGHIAVSSTASAIKMFEGVESFDRACVKHKFATYRTGVSSSTTEEECAVAASWKTAAPKVFGELARKELAQMLKDDQNTIAGLENGWTNEDAANRFASVDNYIASVKAAFKVPLAKYGLVLDDKMLASLVENAKKFQPAVEKAGRAARYPRGLATDAYMKQKATADLGGVGDVLAAGYDDSWTVSKTDDGYPEYKWTKFFILVRPKGMTTCRVYTGSVRKTYEGGGKYGKHFIHSTEPDFQLSRCK
jgi:hypothetical protein